MTVSTFTHVQQRPWRGYDDPGLPVGMYVAQGSTVGDASGGDMIVFFDFKGEGRAASGRYYNLEQVEAQISTELDTIFHLQANNWDLVGDAGLIDRNWSARLLDNDNGLSAMATERQLPLPIFLGIAAPVRDLSCRLEFGANNQDGIAIAVTIQGYIWEPRSVMAEGGLRRPVDSLYGSGRQ